MSGGDLARRAVACPVWRWMPGMRDVDGGIVVFVDGSWLVTTVYIDDRDGWSTGSRIARHALPDLDDPATLGCLLALVREAWGSHVSSIRTGDGWSVRHMGRDGWAVGLSVVGITQCETEAEALVAALEAAPRREVSPRPRSSQCASMRRATHEAQ